MIENIQHDYFIWEEKNSTEQKTKLENNGVNEEVISTNEIKNDSTQKDWKDITDPKERQKSYNKLYYQSNKNKLIIKSNDYYQLNKEKKNAYSKEYRKLNKDKIKKRKKIYNEAWYKINKDKIKLREKIYRSLNKDKKNLYFKNKKKTDIQYKLSCNLRSRLNTAFNSNYKDGSAVRDLGCTIDELKTYLESKFQPGMTWDNWTTDGWHIDHIKPLSSFDLTDRKQLLEACHYTNLQPLWAKDNIIKSDKLV
jgi:hypothetical protein